MDLNTVASGAEDSLLKIWDIRTDSKSQNLNKSHGNGIVFVNASEKNENVLLTGSYDEYLRAFDIRNFSEPVMEHKVLL